MADEHANSIAPSPLTNRERRYIKNAFSHTHGLSVATGPAAGVLVFAMFQWLSGDEFNWGAVLGGLIAAAIVVVVAFPIIRHRHELLEQHDLSTFAREEIDRTKALIAGVSVFILVLAGIGLWFLFGADQRPNAILVGLYFLFVAVSTVLAVYGLAWRVRWMRKLPHLTEAQIRDIINDEAAERQP